MNELCKHFPCIDLGGYCDQGEFLQGNKLKCMEKGHCEFYLPGFIDIREEKGYSDNIACKKCKHFQKDINLCKKWRKAVKTYGHCDYFEKRRKHKQEKRNNDCGHNYEEENNMNAENAFEQMLAMQGELP